MHQCFKKVRIGGDAGSHVADKLMNRRTVIAKAIKKATGERKKKLFKDLQKVEDDISSQTAVRNTEIVREHVKNFETLEGNFNRLGMWKLKDKLIPKNKDSPTAKLDDFGNLVSEPEALKKLYLDHYAQRLKHREIKQEYTENYLKKVKLWDLRFSRLKCIKSEDWTKQELKCALMSLKSNKARDPNNLVNELFKSSAIGEDLEAALLHLVNGVKENFYVPETFQISNITTIQKKNKSKFSLESERGIFTQSVFKKVLDRLIYHDKYPLLDMSMTDSNIGSRKGRNIRNHLFIIHGIINSAVKSESDCVDIHIYDIVKAFDALWLSDCLNDLWDTLPHSARDDRLGLLFETSKKNLVAVNTSAGQTERINMPEIVAQGGTWGPMMCSNSIDKVGKFFKEDDQYFLYKNLVRVIPLACVDDLLSVSKCGFESVKMNCSMNTLIELKKLEFHIQETGKKSKCHKLHVGKPNKMCPKMKVHGIEAETISEALYLGDIIRSDGRNTSNIRERVRKGLGIVSNLMDILKSISFGSRHFEIAVALREAYLVNGILTSSEVWYGMTSQEENEIENIDKLLLRRILGAPDSTCIESLYLELGLIPLHIILMSRRISYLHYLVNLDPEEMLFKVFEAQWKYPIKDDWTLKVKANLKEFGLSTDLDQLKSKSSQSFKRNLKIVTKKYTLDFLLKKKSSHKKMDDLQYTKLELQPYLKDEKISVAEARNLYRFRTKCAKFQENMKTGCSWIYCPLCNIQPDTQAHSIMCSVVKAKISVEGNYQDIFKPNIPPGISRTLLKVTEMRNEVL